MALIPVPVFYLIYYRYFTFRPEFLKHIESFLSGIAFAFAMILLSPYLFSILTFTDPFAVGFLKAALPEKLGALIILLFLFRYFPNFSIFEATLTAAMFGLGFSAVENLFYSITFGYQVILLRILFSVPMHLTTCGILGYYLGMMKMCHSPFSRSLYLAKALIAGIVLHGLFDTILFRSGTLSFSAPALLILMVIILEVLMARAQTIPPLMIIRALELRFEEWMMLERQPRYERWILQSMGTRKADGAPFFFWRPGILRFFLVIALILAALFGLAYRQEIMERLDLQIRMVDQIILFGIFPVSVSFIMIFVGAVNPDFFTTSVIKIPLISDVVMKGDDEIEETLVTYDISSMCCFLRTSEPFGLGDRRRYVFEFPAFSSGELQGEVIWENHVNPRIPNGSIIRLGGNDIRFTLKFIGRYYFFRMRKGIAFNLRLPGFESTRRLFMRPITTVQRDRIYRAGTIIFNEHERGMEFYLLKRGRVRFYKTTERGDTITMGSIDSQQVFGEMSVLGNEVRATSAICETDCVVGVADRDNLNALIRSNTDFAESLIGTLVQRVQKSETILLESINSYDHLARNKDRLYHAAILLALAVSGKAPIDDRVRRMIIDAAEKAMNETGDSNLGRLIDLAARGTMRDAIPEELVMDFLKRVTPAG